MIAVTGATGHLGKLVIEDLIQRGTNPKTIAALVRDQNKAQDLVSKGVNVRLGNYNSEGSMLDALSGIDQLLLVSASEVGQRVQQHTNVVNAAKKAGVRQIAYTSILKADSSKMKLAAEHFATEKIIQDSGLPYIFLRNSWYFENYTQQLKNILASGVIAGSAKDGKVSAAARADYASAAVAVLLGKGTGKTVYELGGPGFTLSELAQTISKVSGKKVEYQDMPEPEYAKLLVSFGLPEVYAQMLADSDVGIQRGELYTESKDLEMLLGRKPISVEKAVETALGSQS